MSDLIFCVRQLVSSNLSWFHATRMSVGEAAGRERAININRPVLEAWYPEGLPSAEKLQITCRYLNGNLSTIAPGHEVIQDSRTINLQGGKKNWRLAGDAIQGDLYGTLREGDLMFMMFNVVTKELSWFCLRGSDGLDQNDEIRGPEVVPLEEKQLFNKILSWLGRPNADRSMWLPDFRTSLAIITSLDRLNGHVWALLEVHKFINTSQEASLVPVVRQKLSINYPHNRILYGAPGTGKSYILKMQGSKVLFGGSIVRITFYPDYSNSQFIGSYKPLSYYLDENRPVYKGLRPYHDEVALTTRRPVIDYNLVPGPFLISLLNAIKEPDQNHLLIIEEINRANASSVFGDIFQLMDRTVHGESEYAITFSHESSRWLIENGALVDGHIVSETSGGFFGRTLNVRIPPNLYIWATMNSADQGVMPLDSAFKRRWSFEYIPLDFAEEHSDFLVDLIGYQLTWNNLRKSINEYLLSDLRQKLRISEDKLIGPFFIKRSDNEGDSSRKIVLNKLLLYIYQDLVRHDPTAFFREKMFSQVSSSYANATNQIRDNTSKEDFYTSLSLVFADGLAAKLTNDLFPLLNNY